MANGHLKKQCCRICFNHKLKQINKYSDVDMQGKWKEWNRRRYQGVKLKDEYSKGNKGR